MGKHCQTNTGNRGSQSVANTAARRDPGSAGKRGASPIKQRVACTYNVHIAAFRFAASHDSSHEVLRALDVAQALVEKPAAATVVQTRPSQALIQGTTTASKACGGGGIMKSSRRIRKDTARMSSTGAETQLTHRVTPRRHGGAQNSQNGNRNDSAGHSAVVWGRGFVMCKHQGIVGFPTAFVHVDFEHVPRAHAFPHAVEATATRQHSNMPLEQLVIFIFSEQTTTEPAHTQTRDETCTTAETGGRHIHACSYYSWKQQSGSGVRAHLMLPQSYASRHCTFIHGNFHVSGMPSQLVFANGDVENWNTGC